MRLGLHRQAIAPVHGGQIQRDFRAPLGHTKIIAGGKGLHHAPIGLAGGFPGQCHNGWHIRRNHHIPFPSALPGDLQLARLHRLKILRCRRCAVNLARGKIAGASGNRFIQGQRANLAIQPQRHL